jgi:hypothetical protein
VQGAGARLWAARGEDRVRERHPRGQGAVPDGGWQWRRGGGERWIAGIGAVILVVVLLRLSAAAFRLSAAAFLPSFFLYIYIRTSVAQPIYIIEYPTAI